MNNISRIGKSTRNIKFGLVNRIITLILPFVLRSVMIKTIGVDYLGLSSLFTSVLGVLNMTELGVGTALNYSMYKPLAENDNKTVCAILNLYKKVYSWIGIFILVLGICCMPFLKYMIHGTYPPKINIYILFIIYLINSSVSFAFGAYRKSIFSANQDNYALSTIDSVCYLLLYLTQIISLLIYRNYYVYVILIPISTGIDNVLAYFLAKKKFPDFMPNGKVPQSTIDDIKRQVFGLFGYKVSNVFMNSIDNIVISAFLGLTIVGYYNNYYTIMQGVMNVIYILYSSIVASVGNSIVLESKEKNYNDFKTVAFIYSWLSGFCAICMLCLFQPFIAIWVGNECLLPFSTVIWLCIDFYVWKTDDVCGIYRDAIGIWWDDRIRPYVMCLVNFTVNIILVKIIGLNGVIISTIASLVIVSRPWSIHILFRSYFKYKEINYHLTQIKYFLCVMLLGALTYWVCARVEGNILIVRSAICLLLPNALWIVLFHKTPEFSYVINKFSNFNRKR